MNFTWNEQLFQVRQRVEQRQIEEDHQPQQEVKQNRQYINPESCWFCLCNPRSNANYIISIGKYNYVSYSIGPLVENQLQIIPIHHCNSLKYLSYDGTIELQRYYQITRMFYLSIGYDIATFEMKLYQPMNRPQIHTHLQVYPIPKDRLKEAKNFFIEKLQEISSNVKVTPLKHLFNFNQIDSNEYYYFSFGNDICYSNITEGMSPTTTRKILAQYFNVEQRIEWKKCKEDTITEENNIKLLRANYEQFDPM